MLRVFRHYIPRSLAAVGTCEALILFTTVYAGAAIGFVESDPVAKLLVGPIWSKATAYTFVMILLMATMGLYARGLRDNLLGIVYRIGLAFLAGTMVMFLVMPFFPTLYLGNAVYTVILALSAAGIVTFRTIAYQFGEQTLFARRVLVLGTGNAAAQVRKLRRKTDRRDMVVVGYVAVPGEERVVDPASTLQIKTTLCDLARAHRVDEVIVAVDERRHHSPVTEALNCKMNGINVMELVTFFEQQSGKIQVEGLSPSDLVFADGFVQAIVRTYLARTFDIAISLILLLLASPLLLSISLAIFIESTGRGSIFYKQERVGRNSRRFSMLKFRSMYTDAEEAGVAKWAAAKDPRITRIGRVIRKYRIDELPQLINVLKGEMSLVGPRPERPEFVASLKAQIPFYDLRHRVNPGITGWAQICYPYGASIKDAKEKLQYDLYYIKNYSIFLDVMILIQTVQVVLWGKGAH